MTTTTHSHKHWTDKGGHVNRVACPGTMRHEKERTDPLFNEPLDPAAASVETAATGGREISRSMTDWNPAHVP